MSGMYVRQAKRSSAKPLIGFYDQSGTGKTLSALFLARGYVDEMLRLSKAERTGRIIMIESESGRGEAHMDTVVECDEHKGAFSKACPRCSYVGGFDVVPIWEHAEKELPFSPRRYGEAIAKAESGGYDALIVDSASHEWEGLGGVLHMAAQNQEEGKKGQLVWQVPKIDHQRHFMLRLMQTPIPLVIVCMRAKYPMEEVSKDGKKEWQRSKQLEPKQSEDVLFEMFVHGHFDPEHRFHGTKYTKPELAKVIPSGQVITNATGATLARWAAGGATAPPADLAAVVASFKAAQTLPELQAAGVAAKGLPADDKGAAGVAYKQALERLGVAPKGEPAPTPAEKEPNSEG